MCLRGVYDPEGGAQTAPKTPCRMTSRSRPFTILGLINNPDARHPDDLPPPQMSPLAAPQRRARRPSARLYNLLHPRADTIDVPIAVGFYPKCPSSPRECLPPLPSFQRPQRSCVSAVTTRKIPIHLHKAQPTMRRGRCNVNYYSNLGTFTDILGV